MVSSRAHRLGRHLFRVLNHSLHLCASPGEDFPLGSTVDPDPESRSRLNFPAQERRRPEAEVGELTSSTCLPLLLHQTAVFQRQLLQLKPRLLPLQSSKSAVSGTALE
mmetsp:Transcript_91638/g.218317  ORF Transcript_91638/g.218317 Transcript_91638/m.218317 type:complete len:108 (-) Transcript_91638:93-416(-)